MNPYRPEVFDATDEESARAIILTPTVGLTTEQRWAVETPYLATRIAELLDLDAPDTIIDFGCGIGRLSKALIEATGCSVVGVDISAQMRGMAAGYVDSPRFRAVSPDELDHMVRNGWRADAAFACWVLQHCPDAEGEVRRIVGALHPASDIVVVNLTDSQAIPVDVGWSLQTLDMRALLRRHTAEIMTEPLPPEVNPEPAFVGMYITPRPAPTPVPGLWGRIRKLFA